MATATRSSGRRGLAWAVIGGLVLVAGIVAIIVASSLSAGPSPSPTVTSSGPLTPTSTPAPSSPSDVVDPSASRMGWVPEPITTDAETYIRAALAAASTFDTQKSSRDEWLTYLDSWFTPDTRFTSDADRQADMQAARLELRQGVVLPEADWDSLASEKGRVTASIDADITYVPVPEDAAGDMRIGTADVTLTYFRADGSGGETSYEEHARVSVQVLCGEGSVPTPNSAQRSGDCKVVRFFTQAMEP